MKYLLIVLLNFLLLHGVRAQEIIATSGGLFNNTQGSVEFTIGECLTATYSKSEIVLTQGFLQPILKVSTGNEITIADISLKIYPNPAHEFINVAFESEKFTEIRIELDDITGKKILLLDVNDRITTIPFGRYQPSIYFVKILNKNKLIKTVKVIKQ